MADLMAQERACDRTSDNSKQRDLFPKARAIENGGLFMQTGAMERGGFKKGETKQTDLFPKVCARESGGDLFAEARARAGAAVQLLFCPCGHAGEALSALLPYGKAALVIDEAVPPQAAERVRIALKKFRPACAVIGGDFTQLFSLADDIRAAVGIGPRGIAGARFFATLRGAFSLLIPTDTAAEGLFAPFAPPPWQGYPLAPADMILADAALLQEAPALACFAGVCAEEAAIGSAFGKKEEEAPFRAIADAFAAAESAEEQFSASAAFALEVQGRVPFACLGAAKLCPRPQLPALAAYFARRFLYLFEKAEIRPFFVADYPARIWRAARESGLSAKAVARNVHIPRGAESFALAERFLEVRARLAASAELLCRTLPAQPAPADGLFARLYDLSAELSPRLSAAVLERELGLLPTPPLAAPPVSV